MKVKWRQFKDTLPIYGQACIVVEYPFTAQIGSFTHINDGYVYFRQDHNIRSGCFNVHIDSISAYWIAEPENAKQ